MQSMNCIYTVELLPVYTRCSVMCKFNRGMYDRGVQCTDTMCTADCVVCSVCTVCSYTIFQCVLCRCSMMTELIPQMGFGCVQCDCTLCVLMCSVEVHYSAVQKSVVVTPYLAQGVLQGCNVTTVVTQRCAVLTQGCTVFKLCDHQLCTLECTEKTHCEYCTYTNVLQGSAVQHPILL